MSVTAIKAPTMFADEGSRKRRKNALDERMMRWARWALAGKPARDLGLPTRSTLAGIQELQLTRAGNSGTVTVRARQSTVPKMLREEEFREEELTERAVFKLHSWSQRHAAVLRAEYLWTVPLWDDTLKVHRPRQVRPDEGEQAQAHRARMAMQLNMSPARFKQVLDEARIAVALVIEELDDGWIAAASGA